MKIFIYLFFILQFYSFANASSLSSDVIIRYSETSSFVTNSVVDLNKCRDRIADIICWVNPPKDGENRNKRPCLTDAEKFATYFQGHFDRSPEMIKKMYCYMDKIFVEKKFVGTAYASPLVDEAGNILSGAIGIRQEVLDAPLGFDEWLSWKEETSFGGTTDTSKPKLGLIKYISNHSSKDFFLDYVLNHEFGHLFDFANNLNATTECDDDNRHDGDCVPLPHTWGKISWLNFDHPKFEFDFPIRDQVCYYFCEEKFIKEENAMVLFDGIIASNFQSPYSAVNPMEDFAETFALYLAHTEFGLKYGVMVKEKYVDLSAHFLSDNLKFKRDYVKNFISNGYIYPGEKILK